MDASSIKNKSKDATHLGGLNSDETPMQSDDLLAGRKELVIAHGGERYRLRVTARNKLILTK